MRKNKWGKTFLKEWFYEYYDKDSEYNVLVTIQPKACSAGWDYASFMFFENKDMKCGWPEGDWIKTHDVSEMKAQVKKYCKDFKERSWKDKTRWAIHWHGDKVKRLKRTAA